MKIHLISDSHIEFGVNTVPSVGSNLVVAAGDIGLMSNPNQLEDYFIRLLDTTDNVIWVLGNHEFYHSEYEETLDNALTLADKLGIHLLDVALGTENLELDGVKFWGTTFWTDLANNDWFVRDTVHRGLNDFYVIKKQNGSNFSAQQSYEINAKSRTLINWDADVVITHHCPTMIPHPLYPVSRVTYAFNNTGLEQQIADSSIKYWFYGHTHSSAVKEYNGTIVMSNQVGYRKPGPGDDVDWQEEAGYDPRLVVEI